ncbi:IPT/TIG domain-containing protein [Myxococcaceae bacterium GXIMD 01537]
MRSPTRALLLLLPLLALSACSKNEPGNPNPGDNDPVPVEVKEIRPSSGVMAGGTTVNVYGSGFKEGAKLYLGDKEATQVVVVSAMRITAKTPAASAAKVDVKVVNPGGKEGALKEGFLYEGQQQPVIAQAEVFNATREAVSTGAPISELLTGAVQVTGVTRGQGQGAGVRAQVGYAPGDANLLDMASYTWADAVYDQDTESGEGDIYKGTVSLQGPTGDENREWAVTLRFSVDGGTTWSMADRDGAANGIAANQIPRVFVGKPRVDWCKLGNDGDNSTPQVHYKPGQTERVKIKGQVFAADITNSAGQGPGLIGELGWGPANEDPRTSSQWHWTRADYKGDQWGNNDEFEATLPLPGAEGTYKFAFRFNVNNGRVRVCDSDGTNDSAEGDLAFNLGKLGNLVVSNEAPKLPVTWCKLGDNDVNEPETVTYAKEQAADRAIVAQVYMKDVTDKVGAGPGLTGQLGWGPASEDPRTSAQWNWTAQLAFNRDRFDSNDEWKATLPNPGTVGSYKFAVRFAVDGGPVRVCDSDGTNDEGLDFNLAKLGALNVQGEVTPPTVVGYCKLGPDGNNTPEAVEYAMGAAGNRKVVGSVYVEGATQGTGQGAGITAELGWGPANEDPRTASGWHWSAATYKGDIGGANDEYEATLPHPNAQGAFKFAYRFKANGGDYRYCDADGTTDSTSGQLAFETEKLGTLTVSDPASVTVGWCKLGGESVQAPPAEEYRLGQAATKVIYAQVYKQGVTDAAGAGAGLQGDLGWGPETDDPSSTSTWTWTAAAFNKDTGNGGNDEFQATLPNPGVAGRYKFAYRFRVGTAGAYRYCDADGLAQDGFTLAQAGNLAVKPVAIDACQLIGPASLSATPGATTAAVRGKVSVVSVTDATSGAAAGITSEVGIGPAGSDPASASGWTWKSAAFSGEDDGNASDVYETTLTAPETQGSYAVAIRFHYQGAVSYCDLDGSGNGYQADKAAALSVAALPTVDWCKLGGQDPAPPPSESALAGDPATKRFYAQLYKAGVTDKAGAGADLLVDIGYGPAADAPSAASWTWTTAWYNTDTGNGGNDEFHATLPIPGSTGAYHFAFRARLGSGPAVYCDADGLDNGFALEEAGTLLVSAEGTSLCRLSSVSAGSVMSGAQVTVAGRVRVPGVTGGDGPGVRVQVGLGNKEEDASATPERFSWTDATYGLELGTEVDTEAHSADLNPAYAGTCSEQNPDCAAERAVSLRYTQDNGATWTYCDADGSDMGGYTPGQQVPLVVTQHKEIPYCNLQWPYSMGVTASDRNVYGQLYMGGVTNSGGAGAGVVAELGYGDANADPGVGWSWIRATYQGDSDNNDEYVQALPENLPAGTGYGYRFSYNGGPFCYGDRRDEGGSTNGLQAASLGRVTP